MSEIEVQESEELFNTEELAAGDEINDEEMEKLLQEEQQLTDEVENTEIENITEVDEELTEEVSGEATQSTVAKKKPQDRITHLPIAKIKHIIKLDPEGKLVNAEALFLITLSTELFIKSLAKESYQFAAQNKKKTITKSHVDHALTMLPVEL